MNKKKVDRRPKNPYEMPPIKEPPQEPFDSEQSDKYKRYL